MSLCAFLRFHQFFELPRFCSILHRVLIWKWVSIGCFGFIVDLLQRNKHSQIETVTLFKTFFSKLYIKMYFTYNNCTEPKSNKLRSWSFSFYNWDHVDTITPWESVYLNYTLIRLTKSRERAITFVVLLFIPNVFHNEDFQILLNWNNERVVLTNICEMMFKRSITCRYNQGHCKRRE